VIDKILINI